MLWILLFFNASGIGSDLAFAPRLVVCSCESARLRARAVRTLLQDVALAGFRANTQCDLRALVQLTGQRLSQVFLGIEPPCTEPETLASAWPSQPTSSKRPPSPALPEFGLELFINQLTALSLRPGAARWKFATCL